jgi:hypothetical protein
VHLQLSTVPARVAEELEHLDHVFRGKVNECRAMRLGIYGRPDKSTTVGPRPGELYLERQVGAKLSGCPAGVRMCGLA